MGTGKKEASRRVREGKTSDGNIRVKGENFYRTAKRVKQLNVYKDGKPERNAQGFITKAASYQSRDIPTAVIEPNRKWFENSRVISQESLQTFREAMAEQAKDPNRFLLKSAKLPMSLIRDEVKPSKDRPVLVESFKDVFGSKATRKRVTMKNFSTINDLVDTAKQSVDEFYERRANQQHGGEAGEAEGAGESESDDEGPPTLAEVREPVFSKGQSRRIWNELYRTIDSSDVIIHVLDARDPLGTTCKSIQDYLRKEAPHKHLIYVLNKCDLVPSRVAAHWVKVLQKSVPTCAFRASVTNPFGKGSLITLLRQFSSLHSDRKQISVGLVGYPNVGKSSLLNTLLGKKTCVVAPIPGETKVWQFVRLMKRIYLIDAPGIVPPDMNATTEDILLRGAVRTEKIENPAQYIPAVIARTKRHHLARTYELKDWTSPSDFLEQLARKRGRLFAGGEADVDGMAVIVLNDFLRGKIPWYMPPPAAEEGDSKDFEGRSGKLGEMPRKRKRDDAESIPDTSAGVQQPATKKGADAADAVNEEDEFEGFGSDSEPDLHDSDSDLDDTDDIISLGVSSEDDESEASGDGDDSSEEDE